MQNILNIIAQAIGLIALVFSLASFQFKSRRGIMAAQMTASLLFCVGAMTIAMLLKNTVQAWESRA